MVNICNQQSKNSFRKITKILIKGSLTANKHSHYCVMFVSGLLCSGSLLQLSAASTAARLRLPVRSLTPCRHLAVSPSRHIFTS